MGCESCTRAGEGSARGPKRGILRLMVQPEVVSGALRVSMLVGTVLNLVNQGEAILAGSGVSWLHLVLNYAVPYCVASYSAARNQMTQRGDE